MKKVFYLVNSTFHVLYSVFMAQHLGSDYEHVLIVEFPEDLPFSTQRFPTDVFSSVVVARRPNFSLSGPLLRYIDRSKCYGRLFRYSNVYPYVKDSNSQDVFLMFHDARYLSQCLGHFFKQRNVPVYLIEDGLALYEMREGRRVPRLERCLDALFGIRSVRYMGASNFLSTIIARQPEELPAPVSDGRSIVQMSDFFMDSSLIPDMKKEAVSRIGLGNGKKILWFGNPTQEDGICEDHMEYLEAIVTSVPEAEFIIKPHPRDRQGKYDGLKRYANVSVIELGDLAWMPIELLVGEIKPSVLMSQMSTAVLNARNYVPDAVSLYCFRIWGIEIQEPLLGMLERRSDLSICHSIEEVIACCKNAPDQVESIHSDIEEWPDVAFLKGKKV